MINAPLGAGGGMFGINDTQNDNSPNGDNPKEADSAADKSPSPSSDAQTPEPKDSGDSASEPAPPVRDDSLISIKEQALTSLSPLVNHLEQTPEERFKTLMMLIQASDNANFIKEAYEAANKISDEKIRAQALLDVINEINYFTQKQK